MTFRYELSALAAILACSVVPSLQLAAQQQQPPPAAQQGAQQGGQQQRRAPRPYAQVITDKAVSDTGGITVHRVDDRWFFEVPDSLLRRDWLLVSRVAAVPTNFAGFTSAGTSISERVIRWERNGDRVMMRTIGYGAYADDSLPIAISVASNNLGAILGAFPIQAFTRDSASYVIDVTDFFSGDTPALSGLDAAQRRTYQVRRLDPARSFVNTVRSFPLNVEVRHTQTFDAAEPPSDRDAGTISLEMRQSVVLLPKEPMRPRYADQRIGFFSVGRVNYGLDEQKAESQSFIRRWRLEPKDPVAYARGELVEPVKPIVYYLDPATPAKWRPYVRLGIQDWQKAFEKAGFRNAILAKDPPSPREDPDWDPEDIRYSVVRWAASLVRNAVGPSTSDPRTGEIIESDITWYHNHMRSYRNRLLIETGAANPAARSLDIPEELMGETMRQVITHEVGHALGLPHNMIASSSFPTDSLRKTSFTNRYGVSATIMDYARQNYVAQPGDGLAPKDFVRRLGPFDDFIINWGYRVLPNARTPEDERAILNKWITEQTGPMAYRYLPQFAVGIDPRAQTEDIGDDAVKSSGYAVQNLKRMLPNLVAWTTTPGEDYTELAEVYGEALGMWSQYMGHVTNWIGGLTINLKTADQTGPVYSVVPKARQKAALAFLTEQVIRTPSWLQQPDVLARIGPPLGANAVATRQAGVLTQLTDARRLSRLIESQAMDPANAYPLGEYLEDLRVAVWSGTPDANRRTLHRVYLERLAVLMDPPAAAPSGGGPGGGGGGGGFQLPPLLQQPNVRRADISALARAQLRTLQADARRLSRTATGVNRAHWLDIADRVEVILEKEKNG
jgi:hypothetical protein